MTDLFEPTPGLPNRPTALPPRFEDIPVELKDIPNWVLWKYQPPKNPGGKWRKVPYQPSGNLASTTAKGTWRSFEVCRAVYEQGDYDGLGFVFDGEIGPDGTCLAGIDFDRCINSHKLLPFAAKWILRLGTYAEASPSGTGMHAIARTKPLQGIKTSDVEVYTTTRYFTFTGRRLDESPIKIATSEVHALVAELRAKQAAEQPRQPTPDGIKPAGSLFNGAKVAEAFVHLVDPNKSLGAGIEPDYWYNRLTPEQKDEVVDYALGVIASNTTFLETEENGGENNQYYRVTTAVARSGAPHAEDIFVKHASAANDPDPEDALREHFARCQKNPRGITVGTLLGLALDHGADFEQWKRQEHETAGSAEDLEATSLGVWDAGEVTSVPPPRGWLLGNSFCRRMVSSLIASSGVGKTTLRLLQAISLAIGRSLTGEHIFVRTRVLFICLEDDPDELERRVLAILKHYKIDRAELKGWLFLSAPGRRAGKLLTTNNKGTLVTGAFGPLIEAEVVAHNIDLVILDPLVKTHSVTENSNDEMDAVVELLADLTYKYDIAVDVPHHSSKGLADPGNPDRGRGASATNAAARLVWTLTTMSGPEAERFGIPEDERREYVRLDRGKLNAARTTGPTTWFRLESINIGNADATYPSGDDLQVATIWNPPESWAGIDQATIDAILNTLDRGLDDGNYYSAHNSVTGDRAAWRAVTRHVPHKSEEQARNIILSWIKKGIVYKMPYTNPETRKKTQGLKVNNKKRPTNNTTTEK